MPITAMEWEQFAILESSFREPPKADIGTGPRITFGAPAPAAWRYSPQSAAPWPEVRRAWPQLSSSFERKLRQFGDTGRDPPHLIFAN